LVKPINYSANGIGDTIYIIRSIFWGEVGEDELKKNAQIDYGYYNFCFAEV
jgi:hypothetical protein